MGFDGLRTIGQIHVSVTDVDRAVAFYRDVLGVPFLFRVQGQPMAFLDCDGVRLYLGVPESDEFRSRGVLYFTVEDIAGGASGARGTRCRVPRRAAPGPPRGEL
jgi:catechol 2,3-dioxygenase-like lactoylglutathione lyase family enzyme